MLCRARPRLRFSVAAMTPSRLLPVRNAGDSHAVSFQQPAAARMARPNQTAFFSSPKLPKIDPSLLSDDAASMYYRSDPHASTVDPPAPEKKTEDGGHPALRLESPLWLAIASGRESYRQLQTHIIDMTKVKGLDSGGKQGADATDNLQAIMAKMDPNTEILHISGDVPTNNQWEALGQYFTKIRFLKVATGWEEDWRDEKFPLHWPVELLVIADAVGERITTPAIMEGRVKHLVLFFTAGLRFEGPRTKELMKDAEMLDFIPHKKKQPQAEQPEGATTQAEGGPPDGTSPPTKETPPKPKPDGVKVFSVPHEWHKWVYDKYADKDITFPPSPDGAPPSTHSEMKHLQILGNDALQMLSYLALAKFHLLSSLSTLTIHSQGASDLLHVPPNIPLMLLPSLANLKTFKLTLGSAMYAKLLAVTNDNNEPFLHVFFPPNIETLHFRGPVSMAAHLDAFADAFGYHDEFLPGLKRMSLVLDLPDKSSAFPREPSLAQLREANGACRRVLDAAAARGVVVEEGFEEPWVEEHAGLFDGVDNRWAVLGSGLGS